MKTGEKWSVADLAYLLGIKRGRITEWIREGWIKPAVPAEGQGKTAFMDKQNAYEIWLFQILIRYGCIRFEAAELLSALGKVRYLISQERPAKPPLRDSGGWSLCDKIPERRDDDMVFAIIDLQLVKSAIDLAL